MGFPSVWDSTLRAEFVTCPQAFKRRRVDGLVPKSGTSIHLIAGAAMAKGLQTAREAFSAGASRREYEAAGTLALLQTYGGRETDIAAKDLEHILAAFLAYLDEYPLETDPFQIAVIDGTPMIEFTFCLDLPIPHPDTGEPLHYAGRFDWTANYKGSLFCVDEKTTSHAGASWSDKWALRAQFAGYVYAARQYGIPITGTLVRGIHLLSGQIRFLQALVYHKDWMLERWYDQLLRDIERAVACYKTGHWDYNLHDACFSYGMCPYFKLCSVQEPDNWLHLYEKEEPWNPLQP